MTVFDASEQVKPIRASVTGALALTIQLLRRVAPDSPDGVRAAARDLRDSSTELRNRWQRRKRAQKKADLREVDTPNDNAWGGVRDRLEAWKRLPADRYPQVARARHLLDTLFPQGTAFLKDDYKAQWLEGDRLLDEIGRQNLADDLNALCGEPFLAEVERTHADYGDALGMTQDVTPAEAPVDLQSTLREVLDGIVAYAIQVVATVRKTDPATVTRQRRRQRGRRHPQRRLSERYALRNHPNPWLTERPSARWSGSARLVTNAPVNPTSDTSLSLHGTSRSPSKAAYTVSPSP